MSLRQYMNTPHLLDNVENKLISIIKSLEKEAQNDSLPIDPKIYVKLADLYNFHKKFRQEAAILNRYLSLDRIGSQVDVMELMSRIERASELSSLVKDNPIPVEVEKYTSKEDSLSLEPTTDDVEKISITSKQKIIQESIWKNAHFWNNNTKS